MGLVEGVDDWRQAWHESERSLELLGILAEQVAKRPLHLLEHQHQHIVNLPDV